MGQAKLEELEEGQWYWHETSGLGRHAVQIAAMYVTDTGITVVTTDPIYERCGYPRGWVVELAPDPLGPDGQVRRAAARHEMGLD